MKNTAPIIAYSREFIEVHAKKLGLRLVPESRIKTIQACTTVAGISVYPDLEGDFVRQRLAGQIGDAIAERLLTFDKLQQIEYGDKDAPSDLSPSDIFIMARFDVIVPEGKPQTAPAEPAIPPGKRGPRRAC